MNIFNYPEPTIYPRTVAASRKGRLVLAVVPSAVGLKYATPKDATKMAAHAHISNVENGDGLLMGSAEMSCVFTSFLTASAVYPATASEANQPPTRKKRKKQDAGHKTILMYPVYACSSFFLKKKY
jgi:hypothetical protein